MRKSPTCIDYEQLVLSELDAAASSADIELRCAHLNRASVYANLGERDRAFYLHVDSEHETDETWKRMGTFAYAKRAALISALKKCNYNFAATAAQLEIGRSTVYRLVTEYNIDMPAETCPTMQKNVQLRSLISVQRKPHMRSRLELKEGKLTLSLLSKI